MPPDDNLIRAFLSSPYKSHALWESHGRTAPIKDSMRAILRLSHKLQPVLAVDEVRSCPRSCVWSPLIEGDLMRASGELENETEALDWCLYQIESGIFTHLIVASDDTIPRKPDYGRNGCDAEVSRALNLGMTVLTETDFLAG